MANARIDADDLEHRWTHLNGLKSSYIRYAEEYAEWTLPYLFPKGEAGTTSNQEMSLPKDAIGAQCVNHLSNKVVTTLFPPQSMFFRLHIESKAKNELSAMMKQEGAEDEAVARAMAAVDTELEAKEQEARDYMDMVAYRPQAVRASQLLIVTGNALEYHPEGKPVQVYSLRDYCVVRDLSGEVIEIMTREVKAFETFHEKVQDLLRLHKTKSKQSQKYEDSTEVIVYNQVKLRNDGKFVLRTQANHLPLDTEGAIWPREKLPWIVLVWNLVRGEDYGRGLVGDYAGAFHAINILTGSLLNIAAVMGDIKFLVNPNSHIDVEAMNKSPPGSYHSGKPEDVGTMQMQRFNEAQFIQGMIERYERQLGQAFLLGSTITRDAERVTAEEIRSNANELEMSNGGIYSRLAATWQMPLANVVLDQIKFEGLDHGITPKVVTGLDSLSRVSELDNIRMWIADMAMLNGVPEDARAEIDLGAFAALVGKNRQVEYKQFMKTSEQKQQEYDRAMQAQRQQQQSEAAGKVAAAAGTAAVQEAS